MSLALLLPILILSLLGTIALSVLTLVFTALAKPDDRPRLMKTLLTITAVAACGLGIIVFVTVNLVLRPTEQATISDRATRVVGEDAALPQIPFKDHAADEGSRAGDISLNGIATGADSTDAVNTEGFLSSDTVAGRPIPPMSSGITTVPAASATVPMPPMPPMRSQMGAEHPNPVTSVNWGIPVLTVVMILGVAVAFGTVLVFGRGIPKWIFGAVALGGVCLLAAMSLVGIRQVHTEFVIVDASPEPAWTRQHEQSLESQLITGFAGNTKIADHEIRAGDGFGADTGTDPNVTLNSALNASAAMGDDGPISAFAVANRDHHGLAAGSLAEISDNGTIDPNSSTAAPSSGSRRVSAPPQPLQRPRPHWIDSPGTVAPGEETLVVKTGWFATPLLAEQAANEVTAQRLAEWLSTRLDQPFSEADVRNCPSPLMVKAVRDLYVETTLHQFGQDNQAGFEAPMSREHRWLVFSPEVERMARYWSVTQQRQRRIWWIGTVFAVVFVAIPGSVLVGQRVRSAFG
jgi:hypothetical protein